MSDDENDDGATCLQICLMGTRVSINGGFVPLPDAELSNVLKVNLIIDESFSGLTEHGMRLIEATLGATLNLRSINLERLVHATAAVPLRALVRILRLQTSSRVTELRVLGTRLQGSPEEWSELAHLINCMRCLEFVCMVEPLSWLEQVPAGALDPLLHVCSCHSTLKFLATNLFSGVTLEAIDDFCTSPNIMGLHVVDTDVSEERVLRLLQGLQTNPRVWFLSVAFCQVITPEHGRAISALMRHNTVLTNLSIKSKKPIREDLVVELAQGLKEAFVEDFAVEGVGEGPVLSSSTRSVVSSMLEQNKFLNRLTLGGAIAEGIHTEIDTMMRLNRAGRKDLVNPTAPELIGFLSMDSVRDNLDCIYYMVSKHPELVCRQETPPRSDDILFVAPTTRKRKHNEIGCNPSPSGYPSIFLAGADRDQVCIS